MAELHAVEKAARGLPPEERVRMRQDEAQPILDNLEAWLAAQLPTLSAKTPLAAAIRHAPSRLPMLRPCLDPATPETENNAAERAMRTIAPGRRNHLLVGSQAGGRAAAIACTLIKTTKLCSADPKVRLAEDRSGTVGRTALATTFIPYCLGDCFLGIAQLCPRRTLDPPLLG